MSQEVTENILKIKTSILPTVDLGASIGSTTLRFNSIYSNSFIGNFTPVGLTTGGILFADSGGAIAQDTTNLSWDNSTKNLSTKNLIVTLNTSIGGTLGVTGNTNLAVLGAGSTTLESLIVTLNTSIGGTLGVTGNTNLAALGAGSTTLASLNCSGNAIFGGLITTTFTNGSVPFITGSGDLTQNNIKLFWSNTNERLGIGTNLPTACLHIATTGVATSDYILVQGPGPANGMIMNNQGLMAINGNTVSSAQLAVTSTNKGFLPPRMTQTSKLAISSPASGLIVYDTTSNLLSYHNGTNWFVPSWIRFERNVDQSTQGTVLWGLFSNSPSNRITYTSGTFTIIDVGIYIVSCSATFYLTASASVGERLLQIVFSTDSGTVLATGIESLFTSETPSTFANANISYLLNVSSANSTYKFTFSSSNTGNIDLSKFSHGNIYRIS